MERARWTSLERKPVWLIAQAFGGVEHWARSPTADELRNMIYQGLVGGAKGVLFYRYCQENERHIQPLALWREVQRLAAELDELGPVLLQEEHSLEAQPASGEVAVAIKEYKGDFYAFCRQCRRRSAAARFASGGLAADGASRSGPRAGGPDAGQRAARRGVRAAGHGGFSLADSGHLNR